jgi:2-dehydro-3-deoxygalactonokinase
MRASIAAGGEKKNSGKVARGADSVQCGSMPWTRGFIAVDWGTTNRRAYRIDPQGECTASFEDGLGMLSVAPGGFPAAAQAIRERLGDEPLLLAGMVGSARGWVEAPYVPCPAGLNELGAHLVWVEPGRIAIVPGMSILEAGHADVMRGEEIQMVGALAAGLIPPTAFVCHPGTHNKWVTLEESRIASFRTVMTGEMFNHLRERGTLADMISGEVAVDDAFRDGVARGLDGTALTAELFSVRARVLLGDLPRAEAASFTSGLLIGADLGVGIGLSRGNEMIRLGRPELTRLYAAGAAVAGHAAREIDGETAFLAGALALARTLS